MVEKKLSSPLVTIENGRHIEYIMDDGGVVCGALYQDGVEDI